MTPDQFARVRVLFDEAIDQAPADRIGFVARECSDDPEVQSELVRLLGLTVDESLLPRVQEILLAALSGEPDTEHREQATQAPSLVGRSLSHYRVVEEISRGGMGIVYRAVDQKLKREVALKVLPRDLVSNPERKRRFVREAQSAASIRHPNIAVVFEIDEVEDETILAMELIQGEMLSDALERGPLPAEKTRVIVRDVARGLARAHAKGIVHRDIKPANLMLDEDGVAKIIDFGLAKLRFDEERPTASLDESGELDTRSRETLPGALMGTIGYMSPEQVRSRTVDARSDLFSLGAVAYEMLTGRMAFERESQVTTLAAIVSEEPPDVALESSEARELMRAVRRCLRKQPEERFQSADALVAAIDTIGLGSSAGHRGPSVAILPFLNMSADPENEYFSDGMSEELINALSRLDGLRVASRSASFGFKGRDIDVAEVGRKLSVGSLLEGSVRRADNRLRITTQLIQVETGHPIWSGRYDRELGDVFAIQDEIANTIVEQLEVLLVGAPRKRLVEPATDNLEAYECFLRGRFFWNRRELQRALDCFNQAVAIDPDYALAHTGVSDANAILGFGYGGVPRVVMPRAKEAAERALRLDDSLAEAHYSMAYVLFVYEHDWKAAAREFERALDIDPSHVPARYMYGFFLWLAEHSMDRALEMARSAVAADPLDSHAAGMLGLILWAAERASEAIPLLEDAIERDPSYFFLYRCLGLASQAEAPVSEAVQHLEQAVTLSKRDCVILMDLAWAHARSGAPEGRHTAETLLRELQARARTEYVPSICQAVVQVGLGRIHEALELLERGEQERDPMLLVTKWWPMYFDPLKDEPRYHAVLERIGWD